MLQYKLIVSDFDGTLRRSEGGISEGNIRAVGDYVAAGGIFALCTGRMMSSILPYAQKLHLSGLVTAYQGAMIRNIESGEIVRDCRIAWVVEVVTGVDVVVPNVAYLHAHRLELYILGWRGKSGKCLDFGLGIGLRFIRVLATGQEERRCGDHNTQQQCRDLEPFHVSTSSLFSIAVP